MKKVWFIIFLPLFLTLSLSGQPPPIKMSVPNLLEEASTWNRTDTIRRVDILTELAFRFRNNAQKRDAVREWAEEAYRLADEHGYALGKADALVRIGLLEEKSGTPEPAKSAYKKALIIRRDQLKKYSPAASVCNNLANIYKQQKDSIPLAIFWYWEGIRLSDKAADRHAGNRSKAMIMNNLGELLTQTGDLDTALFYLDSALIIRKELGHSNGIGLVLLNRGLLYKRVRNMVQFKADIEEALERFQPLNNHYGIAKCLLALGDYHVMMEAYNTALSHYRKVFAYSHELELDDMGTLYQNKGIAHLKLGQIAAAEQTYQQALAFFEEAKDDQALALLFLNHGSFYYEQGKYREAIQNYKRSLAGYGKRADGNSRSKLLNYLGLAYGELGITDSAFIYIMAHTKLQDTLNRAYQDAMNYKQNMITAENKVKDLQIEKEKETQKKMITYGMITLVLIGLLLGLTLLGYYNSRQRRRLAEQNEEISRRKIIEVMQEKELETNYAWMKGVESTRKKIGQELHDSVGSMLSMVKLHFSSIHDKIDAIQQENRQQYDKANLLLDEACEKVRTLSHEMSSAILVKFGLKAQLETLAKTLQDAGKLEVELSVHGLKKRLDTEMEFNIYRIIQELVNNVIRHARASKLTIQLNRFEEMVNIMVEDNGIGFDMEQVSKQSGIGMKNLAARVHELEGKYAIDSRPGKGTSIAIDIPIFETKSTKS